MAQTSRAPLTGELEESYRRFRQRVPTNKVTSTQPSTQTWEYRTDGTNSTTPLVCLPPLSGTADCYFKQMASLCPKGYRIISANYPAYFTVKDFVIGFDNFLDTLGLEKVHLLGSSLGGFLALAYSKQKPDRVLSLVLNNAFASTEHFSEEGAWTSILRYMPSFWLKRNVLRNFPAIQPNTPRDIGESVDFMVQELDRLDRQRVASRISLNIGKYATHTIGLKPEAVTIVEATDCSTPVHLRDELRQIVEGCRVAQMKRAGEFPFLGNAEEFTLHVEVHLRNNGLRPVAPTQNAAVSSPTTHATQDEGESSSSSPKAEQKREVPNHESNGDRKIDETEKNEQNESAEQTKETPVEESPKKSKRRANREATEAEKEVPPAAEQHAEAPKEVPVEEVPQPARPEVESVEVGNAAPVEEAVAPVAEPKRKSKKGAKQEKVEDQAEETSVQPEPEAVEAQKAPEPEPQPEVQPAPEPEAEPEPQPEPVPEPETAAVVEEAQVVQTEAKVEEPAAEEPSAEEPAAEDVEAEEPQGIVQNSSTLSEALSSAAGEVANVAEVEAEAAQAEAAQVQKAETPEVEEAPTAAAAGGEGEAAKKKKKKKRGKKGK